ncbi:MAG TPA: type II toxin-antitoxin system death-on-curing family toxin [Polyangia bacterium]|jgi:death-on-curing protein|nr:type II toxin-antitoxin system death-on-curing family toxin [Polyangia bacterium]
MTTVFLRVDEVLALHARMIERYGGEGGVRDFGALGSALSMPQAGFGGELMHPSLHEQAAAYLFHIVKKHPFVDGNKRVALTTALVFLELNDAPIAATEDALVELTVGAADGSVSKADVAVFFRAHSV